MTAVVHDEQSPNMGLVSHESMQILIPTISVGLFSETGVKYGVDSGMLIVHDTALYMQNVYNIISHTITPKTTHKNMGLNFTT